MFDARQINIAIEIWGAVFCFICLVSLLLYFRFGNRYRGLLVAMFALELLSVGGDAISMTSGGTLGTAAWLGTHVGNFLTYAAAYFLLATFTAYLCERIGEETNTERPYLPWRRCVWVGAIVWSLLTLFGLFYSFDDANVYHRTDWYWLAQFFVFAVSAVNGCLTLRNIAYLNWRTRLSLLFYTLVPLPAALIQMFVFGINYVIAFSILGTVILFFELQYHVSNVLVESTDALARAQVEASESRMAVMVSQIQPHFLFNTLDTIYLLCAEDPTRAQEAIDAFSTYLRANLDSLKRVAPVPIETEIDHVRTYLALEKMSLEDQLAFDIRMDATGFSVPALSVQTLAENAVKHGVGKCAEGGTVRVATSLVDGCYTVVVSDDGVGFDTDAPLTDGTHVGIANTRERLESLCGGTLEIESTPGEGTVATMRIPCADAAQVAGGVVLRETDSWDALYKRVT